jgi:hypothetical protein
VLNLHRGACCAEPLEQVVADALCVGDRVSAGLTALDEGKKLVSTYVEVVEVVGFAVGTQELPNWMP